MQPEERERRWWPLFLLAGLLVAVDAGARLTYFGRARVDHAPLCWFNASTEASVPTWFAVAVTAAAGCACFRQVGGARAAFRVLGALLLYLAIDDLLGLHEWFGALLHPWLGGEGRVYAWVWTLGPVLAVVAFAATLRILRDVGTSRARRLRLVTGFTLLGIALAFEAFESMVVASPLRPRGIPLLTWTQVAEEALEMLAPVVLLTACWPRSAAGAERSLSRADACGASATASAGRG